MKFDIRNLFLGLTGIGTDSGESGAEGEESTTGGGSGSKKSLDWWECAATAGPGSNLKDSEPTSGLFKLLSW